TMNASAAKGVRSTYKPYMTYTDLMRRESNHQWQQITDGLPHPEGSNVFSFAVHQSEPDTFYAVNNTGMYQSKDAGKSWQKLAINWLDFLKKKRIYSIIAV